MNLFPFDSKREKQEQMMEKVEEAIEREGTLVSHAPTGLGKCVSGDTTVLTDEGFREIEEFEYGETVKCNSFDNNLVKQLNEARLTEKKESDLLELGTDTGREIKATRDHKVLRLKNGAVKWVKSENIEEGDFIASPQRIDLPEIDFALTLDELDKDKIPEKLRVKFTGMEGLMKNFEPEDGDLEDKTGVPRQNFTKIRKEEPVKAQHALKLIEESNNTKNSFKITEIHYHNKSSINVPEIEEDFCYFLGAMLGDGSILGKSETISFSTKDDQLENFFREIMDRFDSQVRTVAGDQYGYKSNNKSLAWLLQKQGLPSGVKEDMKIPDCVLTSRENLSNFISGLLDTDGSIDSQGKLELTTKSKQLSTQLLIAFTVFGIRPTRKEKKVDDSTYYRLFISNQKELEKVRENIGFRLDRKQRKLEKIQKEYNPNKNTIPEVSDLIKNARKSSEIPYSRKKLRRRLESYETGRRNPSEDGLRELFRQYDWKEDEENFRTLQKLLNTDIFWDKVDSIKEKEKEKVYDLTEPSNHNFTGNNILLHNTAAALTPSLEKALESDKKVLFLTPRHSQHQIALETAEKINNKHDANVKSVDLIGKDHLCEADSVTRGGEGPDCPRHDNTFTDSHELTDKAKRKIKELQGQALSAEEVKKRCNNVCAYQISLYMTQKADLIVADYFHMFHPAVRDIVLEKAEIDLSDCIIVVDEAHNLPSRTRSLFSANLSVPNIDRAITEAEKFGFYQEQENLEQLKSEVQRLAREKLSQQEHEDTVEKEDVKDPIDNFYSYEELIVDLEAAAEEVHEEKEKSYCSGVAEFLEAWKGDDHGFVRAIKRVISDGGDRRIQINYSCLNPQISTEKPLNGSKASVLMSGTLTPPSMYVDLLGIDEEKNESVEFGSPFPEENKLELVIPTLTTKYEERNESMRQKYAWYLSKSFNAVEGNCAVFFPSYSFMYKIKEELKQHTDRKIFTEDRSLDKEGKQEVLDDFAATSKEGNSVLLGVAAGSFGEGIDYPGEKLKGVFIVGLPLQRPDLETKGLIEFLDEKFGKGWDYGYSYPAMNRAVQAAGRCIRSKEDEGVIVYMDKRYSWSNYRKVLPPETSLKKSRAPWQEIEKFFEERS